jgi:antirestriction protein ArdC
VPNTTVIQFQGIYETQRKTYQGTTSGTLLQTINTCYNGAAPPCTSSAVSLPITQRDSIFGTKIVFWKFNEYETETVDGETENRTSAFLRYYTVFNLEQTEGLKALLALPSARPIESAEAIVAAMPNPPAYQQGFLACYSPSNDTVTMPSPTAFHSRAEHYSTMFHELTHATGHAKRLAREGFDRHVEFGSESYSREELVAEMGSAMLCGVAGIEQATLANSAAYLKSSIARLKSDSRLVISAASAAQKASDYIRGESAKDSPAVAGMHQPADNLIAKTVSHHQ